MLEMRTKMICLVFASLMVISACGSKDSPKIITPTQTSSTTVPADSKEIIIKASNYTFDTTEIHVKQGEKIKLTLENVEGIHGLQIKDLNVDIKGNKSAEFIADKKGTFEFICSISCGEGHMGMKGLLIVD